MSFPAARKKAPPAPRSSRPAPRLAAAATTSRPVSSRSFTPAPCPRTWCATARTISPMLAERAYDFLRERQPGAPKIRCETVPLNASGERKSISVIEIVNDDMPFLVDSVMGEIADRRLDVRLVAHPVLGVRRDGGKLVALGAADEVASARESFIHIHLEPIEDEAARADIVARTRWRARRSAAGGAGLARHARARQRHRRRTQDQSAAAAGRRDRGGDPVPAMAAGRQFHLPRRAQLHRRRPGAQARFRQLARHHAFARAARARARRRAARVHAGDHGVPEGAAPADRRQGQYPRARAPARLSRLYRRQAFRRRRQSDRRTPHRRAVHLDRLYARRPQHSLSAPQDRERRSSAPVSIPAVIPARRWPMCWSIIRATNCSRSTRTRSIASRSRSCSSTSGRACACWRAATASTVSCRCWCSFRANATTATSASRSATISAAPSSGGSRRSIRSSRKARWCACTSSSAAPAAPRPSRARDARKRSRRHRAQLDRWAWRSARAGQSAGQGARAVQPLPRGVFRRLPGGLFAGDRGRRHPRDRRPERAAAARASISITGWRKSSARSA